MSDPTRPSTRPMPPPPPADPAEAFAEDVVDALLRGDSGFLITAAECAGDAARPGEDRRAIDALVRFTRGAALEHELRDPASYKRSDLGWPEGDLPPPLDRVEHVLNIGFEWSAGTEREPDAPGSIDLPIVQHDREWKFVLYA